MSAMRRPRLLACGLRLVVQPVGRRLLARLDVLEEVELDVVVLKPLGHGLTRPQIRPTVAH
jgi:hypothetical protein